MTKQLVDTIASTQEIYRSYIAVSQYNLKCAAAIAYNMLLINEGLEELEAERNDILMKYCDKEDNTPLYTLYNLADNTVASDTRCNETEYFAPEEGKTYIGYAYANDSDRYEADFRVRELLDGIHDFGDMKVVHASDFADAAIPASVLIPLVRTGLVTFD